MFLNLQSTQIHRSEVRQMLTPHKAPMLCSDGGRKDARAWLCLCIINSPNKCTLAFFLSENRPTRRGGIYLGGGTLSGIGVVVGEGVFSVPWNNHGFEEFFSHFLWLPFIFAPCGGVSVRFLPSSECFCHFFPQFARILIFLYKGAQ